MPYKGNLVDVISSEVKENVTIVVNQDKITDIFDRVCNTYNRYFNRSKTDMVNTYRKYVILGLLGMHVCETGVHKNSFNQTF